MDEHGWPGVPRWQRSGHWQTIGAALWARRGLSAALCWQRERWITPDADFIDVDHIAPPHAASMLVLFHGLEGSSASHYAQTFAAEALRRGWAIAVPHFRGCSGEPNRAPRAYHAGDFEEIAWMLNRAAQRWPGWPRVAVGVSLGGNALLRWLQEAGAGAAALVRAAASISAPLDLAAAGAAIDRGLNRVLYARMFLRTMRHKAREKWLRFPGLFDLERAWAARTLRDFDDAFTAPLHGFRGVQDYWQRASSRPHLRAVRVPTLVLNARNDPFVPWTSLPTTAEAGPCVQLWQPLQGGHVGFAQPRAPWDWRGDAAALPRRVIPWLAEAAGWSGR
ncbi:MAG: alpha/beta fold hydrolase [Tepidimonas sp.]|uniref:YheT family hydrolase n=1 Tax=Tepidimonas sp. TaxID=2002775 RepID=UPI00259EF515|nr:alpha/beta fold hydrolase [Tepidimonas sp.]MDM7457697.1 alpha/beta fold hydrolase [Tepidimonas sp.]